MQIFANKQHVAFIIFCYSKAETYLHRQKRPMNASDNQKSLYNKMIIAFYSLSTITSNKKILFYQWIVAMNSTV